MIRRVVAAAMVALVLGACGDDDDDGTGPQQDEIVGTWASKGDNVAPGLVAVFQTDSIIATFNANSTYTVLQYAGGEPQPTTLTGSYEVGSQASGTIRSITANQTQGSVTSTGIFRVTGTNMQYEIIQIDPPLTGVNPPTVAGGFGSTTVGGTATGAFWVQNYVRRQ